MSIINLVISKNFILRSLAISLTIVNSIFLSNYFGGDLFGYFTTLNLFLGLSSQLFSLSFNSYSVRIYAKFDPKDVGVFIINNFLFQFILFVVGILLFKSLYPINVSQNYLLFVILLFFTMCNAVLDNVFTGISIPHLGGVLLIFRNSSILIFLIIYFCFNNFGLNNTLLASMILAESIGCVVFLIFLISCGIINSNVFEINFQFLKTGVISGMSLTLYSFMYLLIISLPRLILSFDKTSYSDLGKFQINYLLAMTVSNLLESNYSTNRLPAIIQDVNLGQKINLRNILHEIKPYLLLMLLYSVTVLVFLPILQNYINGIDLISFAILSINSLLFFFYRSMHYRIYAGSYDCYLILINCLILIFSSVTLYFLYHSLGFLGLLLSTILSTFFMIALSIWFLKFKINDSRN